MIISTVLTLEVHICKSFVFLTFYCISLDCKTNFDYIKKLSISIYAHLQMFLLMRFGDFYYFCGLKKYHDLI
jgi:hypothetical protein